MLHLLGHHTYVCTRHQVWIGPPDQTDHPQPDLAALPEIVGAQHRHLRLLRRIGPAATFDAVLTGFLICAHRWNFTDVDTATDSNAWHTARSGVRSGRVEAAGGSRAGRDGVRSRWRTKLEMFTSALALTANTDARPAKGLSPKEQTAWAFSEWVRPEPARSSFLDTAVEPVSWQRRSEPRQLTGPRPRLPHEHRDYNRALINPLRPARTTKADT